MSSAYRTPDSLTGLQARSFNNWKGGQLSNSLGRKHWAGEPVQKSDGRRGQIWPEMDIGRFLQSGVDKRSTGFFKGVLNVPGRSSNLDFGVRGEWQIGYQS